MLGDTSDEMEDMFTPRGRMKEFWRTKTMKEGRNGTQLSSTFVLANTVLGAGVLALPYAMKECGLGLGVIVLLVVGLLVGQSQHLIVVGCCLHEPKSYEELVMSLFGKRMGQVMEALVFVYQFGACVGYLLVIQEQALPLFLEWTPNGFLATEGGLFLTTMVVVTPLCMLRTLNALQYTSFIGVAAPLFMMVVVVYQAIAGGGAAGPSVAIMNAADFSAAFSRITWFNPGIDIFVAVPLMCFALNSHVMVPGIFAELKPGVQSTGTMKKVTAGCYAIVLGLYLPTAFFGYVLCGKDTPDDILALVKAHPCMSADDSLTQAARMAIAVGGVCCYPLNHFPARSATFNCLFRDRVHADLGSWVFTLEAVVFVAFTTGLAYAAKNISIVFGLLGAICASALMFIFPGLIAWRMKHQEESTCVGLDADTHRASLLSAAERAEADGGRSTARAGRSGSAGSTNPAAGVGAVDDILEQYRRERVQSGPGEVYVDWRQETRPPAIGVFYLTMGVALAVLGTVSYVLTSILQVMK